MTYPPAYPPPQGYSVAHSNLQYLPQLGGPSRRAPHRTGGLRQAPTPAGHGAYMPCAQSAIRTSQRCAHPGVLLLANLSARARAGLRAAVSHQPYQPQQQQFQQFQQGAGSSTGSAYLERSSHRTGLLLPPTTAGGQPAPGNDINCLDAIHTMCHGAVWKAATLVMMIVGCAPRASSMSPFLRFGARAKVKYSHHLDALYSYRHTSDLRHYFFGLRHLFPQPASY